MFTLTNASKETKTILKWGTIILGILIGLFVLYNIAVTIKSILYPAPPPAPVAAFGKITQPSFGANTVDGNFSYLLDTVSGFLPSFPTIVNVYKFSKPKPDLIGLQKAGQKVNAGGFTDGPVNLSKNVYDWNSGNNEALVKTIRLNIVDSNFEVNSNFLTDPNVVAADNLPNAQDSIAKARDFLNQMGYLTADLDVDNPNVKMLSISNGTLVNATSISNTQIMEVNYFPNSIDSLPIYFTNPTESNVNVLIAGGMDQPQIVKATFNLQTVSQENSTYPIKSADAAFNELKKGKAFIAAYDGTSKNISIKEMFLAYYEQGNQDFLIPIIVFKGNDNFYAYLNAVTDEWISK